MIRIEMSKGSTMMLTSISHPEGDLVSNLSDSMSVLLVVLVLRARTEDTVEMKTSTDTTYTTTNRCHALTMHTLLNTIILLYESCK